MISNWTQATANQTHIDELCARAKELASRRPIPRAVLAEAQISPDAMAEEARRLLVVELTKATTSHDCLAIAQRGLALESRFATLVDAAYAKAEAV